MIHPSIRSVILSVLLSIPKHCSNYLGISNDRQENPTNHTETFSVFYCVWRPRVSDQPVQCHLMYPNNLQRRQLWSSQIEMAAAMFE